LGSFPVSMYAFGQIEFSHTLSFLEGPATPADKDTAAEAASISAYLGPWCNIGYWKGAPKFGKH